MQYFFCSNEPNIFINSEIHYKNTKIGKKGFSYSNNRRRNKNSIKQKKAKGQFGSLNNSGVVKPEEVALYKNNTFQYILTKTGQSTKYKKIQETGYTNLYYPTKLSRKDIL